MQMSYECQDFVTVFLTARHIMVSFVPLYTIKLFNKKETKISKRQTVFGGRM